MIGSVLAVSTSASHSFSKQCLAAINLLTGLGVEGDAHLGATVKHRSRVRQDPTQPNLRQVHLMHAELFAELELKGFSVAAGAMGENITTQGIDLLALPVATLLYIGPQAIVEIAGLRNPCMQLDNFLPGLMNAVLDRDKAGNIVRKAGIMGIVKRGGKVHINDEIRIVLPPEPHRPLERV